MIITDDNRKYLAEVVDDAIKAQGLLELVDGLAAKILLNAVDSFIDKKIFISLQVKGSLNDLCEAAKAKDSAECERLAAEVLDSLIDIPSVDDDAEILIFKGAVNIIVGAIKIYIK